MCFAAQVGSVVRAVCQILNHPLPKLLSVNNKNTGQMFYLI
jgi:hypothetical protein